METKTCSLCYIKNMSKIVAKKIQNVETVLAKEDKNVTMTLKIECQLNESCFMNKIKIIYYRNKMIDTYTLKNYLEPMLNWETV